MLSKTNDSDTAPAKQALIDAMNGIADGNIFDFEAVAVSSIHDKPVYQLEIIALYETESEIDLIIEENGVLYPIEIKQNAKVTADEASAFTVLDKVEEKKRGTGAIICSCPQPNLLRDNLLQLPVWYI